MSALARLHYRMPATVGCAEIEHMNAYRCSACEVDFHIDFEPFHCPMCGVRFAGEKPFGEK